MYTTHNSFSLAKYFFAIACIAISTLSIGASKTKQPIHALYVPLANHYAALVAYERYRSEMVHADFTVEKMDNWDLLRALFQSGEVDMAFIMSPLAMDMYREKPHFRWIGLMHRDGNALTINDKFNQSVNVAPLRKHRKPTNTVAEVLKKQYELTKKSTQIGVPHVLSTHSVALYSYLKKHGVSMSIFPHKAAGVLAISVAPSKAPAFIKAKSNRAEISAFEQSLPWADVVETQKLGYIAWYSKDVIPWPAGHVGCVALATDSAISRKYEATQEVMRYIRQAGNDIEKAREAGGKELEKIVTIVRKHIPQHNRSAIIASLDPKLRVINYQQLNIDKPGLKRIMDIAVEGNIIIEPINIDEFADTRFNQQ